jgi:uncharacterized Zn-binding protein involved in type VI secretion
MKGVIRLGDVTTHGSKVISATGTSTVHGIAVARQGDACVCPIPEHSGSVIAEGDPMVTLGGVPVAFDGHKTSCGAALISSVPTSGKS